MTTIKFSLIAGALLATSGIAIAQPGTQGQRAEMTRDQAAASADQHFARLDSNRDGRLTVDEARQSREARVERRQARRGERQGQRQERAFERIDANHDGQVSREEFAQARALRGERRGQRGMRGGRGRSGGQAAARMFGEDGVITAEEFRARALQRFERLDANRDGRVTVAERRELRQRMREERRSRRQQPTQG